MLCSLHLSTHHHASSVALPPPPHPHSHPPHTHILHQVRICQRLNVALVSTPFQDKEYYVNIRKAITAGYFMQVRACGEGLVTCSGAASVLRSRFSACVTPAS